MSNENQTNLSSADLWIRLIYMIIFGLLSALARFVVMAIAVLQFLLVLLTCEGNKNLRNLGDSIAQWTHQTYLFLCFASEQKPYPFQDWPQAQAEESETSVDAEPEVQSEANAAEAQAGAKESNEVNIPELTSEDADATGSTSGTSEQGESKDK